MKKNKSVLSNSPLSDAELLALAAKKLKGRVLFPKKVENAKKYLKNVRLDIP
jgi:hypothetical protein